MGKSENSNLRQKAEDNLKRETLKATTKLSETDALKLIHELQVHQIELELQNEELVQARLATQDAVEKYTELYDFAPSGYFTLSKKGEILELNLAGAKMLDNDRSRLKNTTLGFFVANSAKVTFDQFLTAIFNNKKNEVCDIAMAGGENTFPLTVHLTGIVAENRVQCLVTMIDLSERKQAEQAIKENKERFDLAMNATQDGLYDWDLISNEIYYSPGWKRMLGYNDDELPNDFTVWAKLTEPEDVEQSWKMQQELINKQRDRFELEFKMKHKNGHWVDILSRADAVFDDSGKAIRIVGTHVDITERKKAEENLQNTFDISPSIISKANVDSGFFIEANQAVTRILGYTIEEFTSKPLFEFIHPDDRQKTNDEISEQLKGNTTASFENRYLCKDGSYKWMAWNATKADENGIVTAIGSDISEAKKAELALKESENNMRLAVANSPIPIMIHDEDDNILQLSKGWTDFSGYTIKDIPTMGDWTEKAYGSRSGSEKDYIDKLFEINETVKNGEWTIRAKDGSRRIWDFQSTPLGKGNGGKRILHSMAIDITEQKQGEEALRNSQQITEGIINSIPVRVFWKDLNLVYLGCNKIFATDAGFASPKDIVGKDDYQMTWRDQADLYRNDDLEVIKSGVAKIHIEEPQTTPDGKTIYLLTSKIPLRDSQGEVVGVLGTYLDITDRKKTEEELSLYRDSLEELVKERTAELEEKNKELENFNQLFVGRELRIMELKDKVKRLEQGMLNN